LISNLRRSGRRCEVEGEQGPLHDLGRGAVDVDDHAVLIGCRRLKSFHLGGQHRGRHEVVRPGAYPGRERVRASMEVHEPDFGIRRLQDVAITPAKRGAGDDLISFGLLSPVVLRGLSIGFADQIASL
jgi:hypothetical protein